MSLGLCLTLFLIETAQDELADPFTLYLLGTDLHEYLAGPLVINPKERPHAITGSHAPVVLGHEFCGRVVKTTPGSDLKLGQV